VTRVAVSSRPARLRKSALCAKAAPLLTWHGSSRARRVIEDRRKGFAGLSAASLRPPLAREIGFQNRALLEGFNVCHTP